MAGVNGSFGACFRASSDIAADMSINTPISSSAITKKCTVGIVCNGLAAVVHAGARACMGRVLSVESECGCDCGCDRGSECECEPDCVCTCRNYYQRWG